MKRFDQHSTAEIDAAASVGGGCVIGPYARIGPGVSLGDGCSVAAFAYLSGAVRVECGAAIGPHVCIVAGEGKSIVIHQGARIGAQATVAGGFTIGDHAVVEPGAVVNKNVPANAIVAGNPARIVGYVATAARLESSPTELPGTTCTETSVRGVRLYTLPMVEDLRGNLTFGEAARHVPFDIKRYFLTFSVDSEEARGEHAHRRCEQFLVAVAGRVHLLADDGANRQEFVLDSPTRAVYLPPMVWGVQSRFSAGAVLLVLCSDYYDPADYIRDYGEFAALTRNLP